MFNRIRKSFQLYKRDESAIAGVEFALVALPFLLMIFGVMEAGRLIWSVNGVQYAVEQTARYASLNSDLTNEDFQSYAEDQLSDMAVSTDTLDLQFSVVTSNGINFVVVDASYTYSAMVGEFLPSGFGDYDFTTTARKPVIN